MKNKSSLFVTIFTLMTALFLITGCKSNSNPTSSNSGGPGANEVWMQGNAFNPASRTITAGTSVTWTNKDGNIHTATSGTPGSPDNVFNSGNMNSGATFSFKFNNVGTFKYYCTIHGAMMTGTIVVQTAPTGGGGYIYP